jgi:hypothetical protein
VSCFTAAPCVVLLLTSEEAWNAPSAAYVRANIHVDTVWDGLIHHIKLNAIEFTRQHFKELGSPVNGEELAASRAKQLVFKERRRIEGPFTPLALELC